MIKRFYPANKTDILTEKTEWNIKNPITPVNFIQNNRRQYISKEKISASIYNKNTLF
jgi:hypothetical protein